MAIEDYAHRVNPRAESSGPDEWECEIDTVKECGKAPKDDELIVFVKPMVKRKIDLLMDKYTSREWLAYLFGTKTDDEIMIEDMDVPKQKATAAAVNDVEYEVPEGKSIIGVIHSHHSMGTNFSGTDDNWINLNHDVSILVAHNGITARVRWTAPCGAKKAIRAKVRLSFDVDLNEEEFMADVEKKLEEERVVTHGRYSFVDDDYYEGGYGQNWYNKDKESDVPDGTSLRDALKADGIT